MNHPHFQPSAGHPLTSPGFCVFETSTGYIYCEQSPPRTNHVFEATFELQTFRESRTYKFCFIGALALQPLGEPRITVNVDLTLLIVLGKEVDFVTALTEKFCVRRADAAQFALKNQGSLCGSARRDRLREGSKLVGHYYD